MYRFQLLTMSHGSAGLAPAAVAQILRVEPGFLPIDLPGTVENMQPRSDLIVYCFEADEMPGMHYLGSLFLFVHEKPDGTCHILDSGGRRSSLNPREMLQKIRCFSSKGLNYYEFTCFKPSRYVDPANAATA